MFGGQNPLFDKFVGAFSQLEHLRYQKTFEGDSNVYIGHGNHNPISVADMQEYINISGMVIEADEYGFLVADFNNLVPAHFPDSAINTFDENGEALYSVQMPWKDYTICVESAEGFFAYIGRKINGNFEDIQSDEIHRVYFDYFGIINVIHRSQITPINQIITQI